ncbi:MAG: hypothetical protein ACI395_09620 [Candidatus Cryptobacteroides sp.]
MKSLFKSCGMFLVGVIFAVSGCTYSDDIAGINNKLNDEVAVSISSLDDAIKSLETKMQSDYALKSEVSTLKTSLETKINDEVAKLNASVATLKASLDDLSSKAATKSELAAAQSALEAKIKKAVDDANSAIASINSEISKLQSGKADKAELEALKGTLEGEIASAKSALEAKINAVTESVNTLKSSLESLKAAVDKNTSAVAENKAAIAELAASLQTVGGQIVTIQGQVADLGLEIAGIKTRLDAAEAAIDENAAAVKALSDEMTALSAKVDAADAAIAEAKAAIAKNASDVAANAKLISANAEKIQLNAQAILKLQEADVLINKRIDELKSAVDSHIQDYNSHIAAYNEFVKQYAADKKAMETEIESLKGDMADEFDAVATRVSYLEGQASALDSRISEVEKNVTVLEGAVSSLETKLGELNTELDNFKAAYDEYVEVTAGIIDEMERRISKAEADLDAANTAIETAKADAIDAAVKAANAALETAQSALDKKISDLSEKVEKLNERLTIVEEDITDLSSKVDELIAGLKKDVDDAIKDLEDELNKDIDELNGKIEEIIGRIQSLVYVPVYNDGKADINVLKLGGTGYVEGTSVLKYKVTPAECASQLAPVAAEVFSFDLETVLTRAAADEPAMTVVSAEAQGGVLAITVKTRNFGDEFYAGTKSYSASLVLSSEATNIASAYTNLVPKVNDVFDFHIYSADGTDITGTTVAGSLEFPYNKAELEKTVLEGHYYGFTLGGVDMTLEQMLEAGYEIEVSGTTDPSADTENFIYALDTESGYLNASLTEAARVKDKVGTTELVTYTYTVAGQAYSASQTLKVAKESAIVTLPAEEIKWTYASDVEVDGDILNPDPFWGRMSWYTRTFEYTEAELAAVAEDLPEDIELLTVFNTYKDTTFVGTTTSVSAQVSGDKLKVTFFDFEWDKEYSTEFTYTYDDKIDVTLKIAFNTVDRNREAIEIDWIEPTVVEFQKDMTIAGNVYKYNLIDDFDLFGALKAGNYLGVVEETVTAKDYLAGVIIPKGDPHGLTLGDSPTNGAYLALRALSADEYICTFNYDYSKYTSGILPETPLDRTFTTWYGQEIKVKHTLNFTLPVYDFADVPVYVAENENGFYSNVMGLYDPELTSAKVSAFSVNNVKLTSAFNVVDKNGNVVADLVSEGLVQEFEIETESHTGIDMTDNVISYNGKNEYVDVKGNLYIENTGGIRVKLPTSFDENGKYASYRVNRYDPIGTPVLKSEAPVIKVTDSKVYTVNMLDYITLKDYRDGAAAYDLISNGGWVVGDDSNGYAAGVDVKTLYNLEIGYNDVEAEIESSVRNYFDFNDGVLIFDASVNLTLLNPIEIPVKMTIDYTWGSKEIKFTVTVTK